MRTTLILALLGVTLAVGCDDPASSTTTTTAATADSGTTATEDLKQAGRNLGSAAQKAAGQAGQTAADEAKKEIRNLDVKVTTSDAGP